MGVHKCNKEVEIAKIQSDVSYIRQSIDELKPQITDNTKFRNQATGIIAFVAFVCGSVGAGFVWLMNKIWGR